MKVEAPSVLSAERQGEVIRLMFSASRGVCR